MISGDDTSVDSAPRNDNHDAGLREEPVLTATGTDTMDILMGDGGDGFEEV